MGLGVNVTLSGDVGGTVWVGLGVHVIVGAAGLGVSDGASVAGGLVGGGRVGGVGGAGGGALVGIGVQVGRGVVARAGGGVRRPGVVGGAGGRASLRDGITSACSRPKRWTYSATNGPRRSASMESSRKAR